MLIEEQTLVNIQLDSEKQTALDKAMTYLTASVKTEKQVCDYLSGKGYTQAVTDYVCEKLNGYGFLSDEDYARRYVETYSKSKGVRLIKTELKRKGVSDEDMQGAIEDIQGQSETAAAIAEKYMRGKVVDIKTVQKLYRHLLSKGFTYDDAKSAVEKIKLNDDEIE
jgi:regulatory protein